MRKKPSLKFVTFLLTLFRFIADLARKCHRHDCQCRWQFFFRPPGLRLEHQYSKLFCYSNINVLFMHLSPIGVKYWIKYYNMTWTKEKQIISSVRPM